MLTHLQRSGKLAPEGEGLTVITVEHASKRAAALPEAGLACLNRAMDLFMQGKLARPLPPRPEPRTQHPHPPDAAAA